MRLALAFVIGWMAIGCGADVVSADWSEFEAFDEIPAADWQAAPSDTLGDGHVIVLRHAVIVDEHDNAEWRTRISHHVRARVLDGAGIERERSVELPYRAGQRIVRMLARTVKPDGRVVLVPRDHIRDKLVIKAGGFKVNAKAFAFEGVEPGDIVEYLYTIEYEGGMGAPAFNLQLNTVNRLYDLRWIFRPNVSQEVRLASGMLDFIYAPAWVLTNKARFTGSIRQMPDEKNPEELAVHWEHVPPRPEEPFMPPAAEVATMLILNYQFPVRDKKQPFWERLAEDWGKVTRSYLKHDKKLSPLVKELRAKDRNLDSDLAACFELVHRLKNLDRVAEHERPAKPETAEDLDHLIELGYGRDHDLNYLAVAILGELGYPTTIFWTADRVSGRMLESWHSDQQFTMGGVAVQDSQAYRFLFPAIPLADPKTVPWEATGCQALLENIAGKHETNPFPALADIPLGTFEENQIEAEVRLRPDEDGKARGRLTARWREPSKVGWVEGLYSQTEKDRKESLRAAALPGDLHCDVFEEQVTFDGIAVTYACSLEVDGMIEVAGERRLVALGSVWSNDISLGDGPRTSEVHFSRPYRSVVQMDLEIPEGMELERLPEGASFQKQGITLSTQYLRGYGILRRIREHTMEYVLFRASGAPLLEAAFDEIRALDAAPIMLRPKREATSGE